MLKRIALELLGECVISLLLSRRSKDLDGGPVLQLGYSWEFYLADKGWYTLKTWGQADPKGEASVCLGFLLLYICLFHTLSLPSANWGGQEVGVLVSLEVLIPVCGFSFVPFLQLFPFLCLLASAVLDSFLLSCSNYLTELKHKSVQGDSETSVGLWRK